MRYVHGRDIGSGHFMAHLLNVVFSDISGTHKGTEPSTINPSISSPSTSPSIIYVYWMVWKVAITVTMTRYVDASISMHFSIVQGFMHNPCMISMGILVGPLRPFEVSIFLMIVCL